VDDTPVPPRPESPNQPVQLNITAVRHLQRTGAILVAVNTSVAGSLDVHVPRQFHVRILGGSTQVPAGRTWLRISLSPGSKDSWPRDSLRKHGSVRFTFIVGLVPTSGRSVSRVRKLRMWR
jgi:hypothetical protein